MASKSDKTSSVYSPDEEEKKIPDDLEYPITSFTDYQSDMTQFLFTFESVDMPKDNYTQRLKTNDLDIYTIRQESLSSIQQFCRNFDVFVPYYAINYLDRFISVQKNSSGKPWFPKVTAGSCFSLAAKVQLPQFKHTDLERFGVGYEVKIIKKMETLILGRLKCRTRPITPFSFLCYYISLSKLNDSALTYPLRGRTAEIIFKTQTEIDLLEFKPSIIAASAILIVFEEQHPSKFSSFRDEITSSIFINSNRLVACREIMNSILMNNNKSESESVSVSDSTLSLIPLVDQLDLNQDEENTTTTTINDSVFQDDSTMVEPERDDDDNN